MNALLIEDNLVLATITSRRLRALRFMNVDVAYDGDEALRFLERHRYDIILVDWILPGTSGLEIVRHVRTSQNHQGTPIIMMTGRGEREDMVTALQSGVDAYLVKPISSQLLEERIDKVFSESSHARRQAR